MKIKVMYYSRTGNTKKVADAIASVLNQTSESVPPAYPLDNVKLLFLGSGIYGGNIDSKMKDFIGTLDVKKVKNVALFSTSAGQNTAIKAMKDLLEAKGINVLDETFSCSGKFFFFFNHGHPNKQDLKNAQDFAIKAVNTFKE